ncbi:MAG TPA: prolyl oligopeptidase family serine peptidase, partial [Alphaproteobacteria bacterium]|nr:prolyl oligopeptidase family serine peptidase [Alphaproteobacteria bacterium]
MTIHSLLSTKSARLTTVIILLTSLSIAQSRPAAGSSSEKASALMKPPQARIEAVVNDYHGHKVSDPYRWLEDAGSPETQKFVEQQNAYTQSVLAAAPGLDRAKMRSRIEQLLSIGRVEAPAVRANLYFHTRRDGNQNQPVVYVREGVQGKDRPIIDVNALAADGTIALDWWYPSHDGRYVAYGTSPNGSEISTLRVIETASGKLLPEQIGRTRAASVAWLPDGSGFYYTKYPRPGDVPAGEEMYNRHVFFHKLGSADNSDGLKDPLIFGEGIDPQRWPNLEISDDGKWLLVSLEQGWTKTELFLKNLADPAAKFVTVTTGKDFLYYGSLYDGQLYISTNEDAPRYHVFKTACATPERSHWKEILPQGEHTISDATVVGGKLFVQHIKNASSALSIFDLGGKRVAEVAMPTLGSIIEDRIGGSRTSKEAFFAFYSYAMPPTVYRVSLDGQVSEWDKVPSDIDARQYEVRQLWSNSKDGTRVPMFVVSKKGLVLNGKNPTLLSGYGGFNIGRTPFFNRGAMLLLLEHGGVYVDVQLRGGSEFGEAWHRAGMLENRQNVFDDFIAAAEYL